jgi:hypothetical protein
MVIAIRPRILQACQLQIRWKENSVQILAISSKNPGKSSENRSHRLYVRTIGSDTAGDSPYCFSVLKAVSEQIRLSQLIQGNLGAPG